MGKVIIIKENQLNNIKLQKTIKISENITDEIVGNILMESFNLNPDIVLPVKKYLDNNFIRSVMDDMDTNGYPEKIPIVSWVSNGVVLKTLHMNELLQVLNDKFEYLIEDKYDRNEFLKQIIKDWFDRKITKEGMLSVNYLNNNK